LKQQGLVTTRQFSVALGSVSAGDIENDISDAGLGELLFSGLNTRKYAGELQKLDSHSNEDDARYVTQTSFFKSYDEMSSANS
jgi:hypothetical protein